MRNILSFIMGLSSLVLFVLFLPSSIGEASESIISVENDSYDSDTNSSSSMIPFANNRYENPNLGGVPMPYATAFARGGRTLNHSASTSKPPTISKSNSSRDLLSGGKVKQRRYYGEGGRVQKDIDYFHGGDNHTFPHYHLWTWKNGNPSRGGWKP